MSHVFSGLIPGSGVFPAQRAHRRFSGLVPDAAVFAHVSAPCTRSAGSFPPSIRAGQRGSVRATASARGTAAGLPPFTWVQRAYFLEQRLRRSGGWLEFSGLIPGSDVAGLRTEGDVRRSARRLGVGLSGPRELSGLVAGVGRVWVLAGGGAGEGRVWAGQHPVGRSAGLFRETVRCRPWISGAERSTDGADPGQSSVGGLGAGDGLAVARCGRLDGIAATITTPISSIAVPVQNIGTAW